MTFQLLTMLSAAALATSGFNAPGETRSAQSLPAQNLALVQSPTALTGKINPARHLADAATDGADQSRCEHTGGSWDDKHSRCRRAGGWWDDSGIRLLIGAGTIAGIVIAVTEGNHNSVSNRSPPGPPARPRRTGDTRIG